MEGKKEGGPRNATIVYSGGDDLFIVGAWNEVIELAVDLRRRFELYTEGTLTLSAGIGVYHDSYPISAIASEVAEMEDASKSMPGKNAVTLLEDGGHHTITISGKQVKVKDGTCSWEEFEKRVLEDKLIPIRTFFDFSQDRGKAFLYHLLDLIRNQEERINFARFVYLLSRMEPDERAGSEEREAYRVFSEKMFRWITEEQDRAELKMAITIYAYLTRNDGEGNHRENNYEQ